MPWKECSTMKLREEFVRLADQDNANRRALCRRFGISPQTGYKWLRRWRAGEDLNDLSHRPRTSPGRSPQEVEQRILSVRDTYPAWGARKIRAYLQHQGITVPASSTVHAILQRHDRIEPKSTPRSPDWQRFEAPLPNQLWQMDFKGWIRLEDNTRCHPLTVVDDHSRFATCLKACPDQRTNTVKTALEESFKLYGLPRAFLVDNGSPWGTALTDQRWTPLRIWLAHLGVRLIHARPFHPQTKGKNERFNRTLKEEVLAYRTFRSHRTMQSAFDQWRRIYNFHRPHEALGLAPPISRYTISQHIFPKHLPDISYPKGTMVRKVPRTRAEISFNGRLWYVPKCFRGYTLAIRPSDKPEIFNVCFAANTVAKIDLTS
ncbi:Integrase core domain protein [Pseudovibrio sp. Ad46]|nr:Integrase core domain protein [Pseudovibrio sp. Ad46]